MTKKMVKKGKKGREITHELVKCIARERMNSAACGLPAVLLIIVSL